MNIGCIFVYIKVCVFYGEKLMLYLFNFFISACTCYMTFYSPLYYWQIRHTAPKTAPKFENHTFPNGTAGRGLRLGAR